MDANKLKVLRDIGYVIRPCCYFCVNFCKGQVPGFGTCKAHQYQHEKHTGGPRDLSVHANGICADGKYEVHPDMTEAMGMAWQEFIKEQ